MASVDQNSEGVSFATGNDSTAAAIPLQVDPITRYLLVHIVGPCSGASPADATKVDANSNQVSFAYNDSTGVAVPLQVDTNGYIQCDFQLT